MNPAEAADDVGRVDYAPRNARVRWATRTARGDTCFTGLRTKREAERLAAIWSAAFPTYGPYSTVRVKL